MNFGLIRDFDIPIALQKCNQFGVDIEWLQQKIEANLAIHSDKECASSTWE